MKIYLLHIQGDLNYNQSQYMQALKCYIMFGSSKTNFFTQISNIHLIYDDQVRIFLKLFYVIVNCEIFKQLF